MEPGWFLKKSRQGPLPEFLPDTSQADSLTIPLPVESMTCNTALLVEDLSTLPDLPRGMLIVLFRMGSSGNQISRNMSSLLLRVLSMKHGRHTSMGALALWIADPPDQPVLV